MNSNRVSCPSCSKSYPRPAISKPTNVRCKQCNTTFQIKPEQIESEPELVEVEFHDAPAEPVPISTSFDSGSTSLFDSLPQQPHGQPARQALRAPSRYQNPHAPAQKNSGRPRPKTKAPGREIPNGLKAVAVVLGIILVVCLKLWVRFDALQARNKKDKDTIGQVRNPFEKQNNSSQGSSPLHQSVSRRIQQNKSLHDRLQSNRATTSQIVQHNRNSMASALRRNNSSAQQAIEQATNAFRHPPSHLPGSIHDRIGGRMVENSRSIHNQTRALTENLHNRINSSINRSNSGLRNSSIPRIPRPRFNRREEHRQNVDALKARGGSRMPGIDLSPFRSGSGIRTSGQNRRTSPPAGRNPAIRSTLPESGATSRRLATNRAGLLVQTPVAGFGKMGIGVTSMEFTPDDRFLICGHRDRLTVHDLQSERLVETIGNIDELQQVSVIAVSPDGQHVIAGGESGSILVWRVGDDGSLEQAGQFIGHESRISSIAVDPTGRFVFSGDTRKTARLWNLRDFQEIGSNSEFDFRVIGCGFINNGRVAVACSRYTLVFLDTKNGRRIRIHENFHESTTYSAAFSPDGLKLAIATTRDVKIYETKTAELLETIEGAGAGIHWSLRFSQDGSLLMSGQAGLVNFWNADGFTSAGAVQIAENQDIMALAVTSDNGRFTGISPIPGQSLSLFPTPVADEPDQ